MVARLNEKRYSTTKSELGLQGAGKVLWKFPSFCQDADQEDWFSVYKDCNPEVAEKWDREAYFIKWINCFQTRYREVL